MNDCPGSPLVEQLLSLSKVQLTRLNDGHSSSIENSFTLYTHILRVPYLTNVDPNVITD